jgi:hypothetical protein
VLRGSLPDELKSRESFTFARALLGREDLDGDSVQRETKEVFYRIAEAVRIRCETFRFVDFDPCGHCNDARIPAEADILDWLRKITRNPPFPWSGAS